SPREASLLATRHSPLTTRHSSLRATLGGIAGRGPEVDQPGPGRRVGGGEGLAEADAQRPELLRAERGVVDPAGVFGSAGLGGPARTGQAQEVANLPADCPSG